ncbi:hypothetical protein ACI3PL_26055, partial [Lacticaseibacillus paracasei]
ANMNKLTESEVSSLTEVMIRCAQIAASKMGGGKNCLDCFHFEETSEVCAKFGKRPPAKVICNGCKFHDSTPF